MNFNFIFIPISYHAGTMNISVGPRGGGNHGNQVARQQRYNQMRGQQQMRGGNMGANTRGAVQGNRGGMNQGRGLFIL